MVIDLIRDVSSQYWRKIYQPESKRSFDKKYMVFQTEKSRSNFLQLNWFEEG